MEIKSVKEMQNEPRFLAQSSLVATVKEQTPQFAQDQGITATCASKHFLWTGGADGGRVHHLTKT